jgi:Arc/MetJ-type ribon-helix-helix transcriptional regulator
MDGAFYLECPATMTPATAGMTYCHTMGRAKIAITVDEDALAEIDQLVAQGVFQNRSRAFEAAIQERIATLHRSRLARECAKLDKSEEQALAEEGYAGESQWPEY